MTAGARVVQVASQEEIRLLLQAHAGKRILSTVPGLESIAEAPDSDLDPHTLADVEAVVLQGRFGVAENGAIWLQEQDLVVRALPFICQHLYIVLEKDAIVPDMHAAYERIGAEDYHFGLFLCGPSKTADIEQSLVMGAHGARTLTIITGG
jgi:L-lactate dehydrogenase complex protein LldG